MSEEWPRATLGKLAVEVRNGIATKPDADADAGVPILRISAVRPGVLSLADLRFLHQASDDYALREDDLLFTRYSGTPEFVGSCARVPALSQKVVYPDKLIRVRLDRDRVEPRFVEAAWASEVVRQQVRSALKTSAGQVGISGASLKEIELPVPPLAEQRSITAKLDALRSRSRRAKAALDAVPALLGRLRQSILAAAFRGDLTADWREQNPDVEPASELLKRIRLERRKRWEGAELATMIAKRNPPTDDRWKSHYREPSEPDTEGRGELPARWCWSTVETVGDVDLGRQRAPQYARGIGTRPYLRVANIKDNYIDFTDVKEMDFDDNDFEHYRLEPNDILLSEGQSPSRVGESAIYRGEIAGLCFQKTLHRFRRFSPAPSSEYFQLLFRHFVRQGIFRSAASLTTNIAHLTLVRLKPLPLPLPPLAEAEEIARRASALLASAERLTTSATQMAGNADGLDAAILAAAFRGELVARQSDRSADV